MSLKDNVRVRVANSFEIDGITNDYRECYHGEEFVMLEDAEQYLQERVAELKKRIKEELNIDYYDIHIEDDIIEIIDEVFENEEKR